MVIAPVHGDTHPIPPGSPCVSGAVPAAELIAQDGVICGRHVHKVQELGAIPASNAG